MTAWGPHPEASAITTDEARAGRSELEWRLIRDPERAVRGTAALLAGAGPDRDARLFEGVARTFGAYNRRDWEINSLFVHRHDFVFEPGDLAQALPGLAGIERGVTGYLRAQLAFIESWSELGPELVELVDIRPSRLVVDLRWTGTGAGSGIVLGQGMIIVQYFADGLVVRQAYWWNRERALTALGLRPPGARR
jgi:hypothetical protein